MSEAIQQLAAWTTHNALRRLDHAQRDFAALEWSDGAGSTDPLDQTTLIHGAHAVEDEWQILARGFYQDSETLELRLAPFVVYPGKIVAPYVTTGIVPPADSLLVLRISYGLSPVNYPALTPEGLGTSGWNGRINSTATVLLWHPTNQPLPANNIFPSGYTNSMPAGNNFVWHASLGQTDSRRAFTRSIIGLDSVCGQLIPPL
jgi:hypothetical protein